MKKTLSVFLILALTLSATFGINATAASEDILMLYDGEGDTGNGSEDPWGRLAGHDTYYYTEGTSGYAVQSFFNGVYFFQNTESYLGKSVDISGYDYIEFDMMSYYDMVCDLELSVVRNFSAHHGSDYEMFEVYLPAETFVHVKMSIKDFVTLSTENRDKYDTQENIKADDPAHFAGYSLDHVSRLRWQLTYCTTLDGYECDDIYVVFDNVHATKNGATHTHGGSQPEVEEIQYYKDVDFTEYTLTFDTDGGNTVASQSLTEGQKPATVKNPVKEGYTFDGWYDGDTKVELTAFTMPAKDVTLTAHWIEAASVKPDYGNVDGSDAINAADALMVLKSSVGKLELTPEQKILADVDGNGSINATDALQILQYAVNKIDQFKVESK